jgi:5-methyltetrahydrofolate--homocysteine methyltransferase
VIGGEKMSKGLIEAMVEMKEQEALSIAKELIDKGEDAMNILDSCSAAMETVGKRFEKGEYFLPQLMMAGEMLSQISVMVKPFIKTEKAKESLGKVLMGTVKGDIHDIGKDIVIFLLDVNGFEVKDIGVDAPPEKFVEAIKEFKPQIVGMSGLLTLAYDSMKETVQAIKDAGLRNDVKIMIGGGQMDEKVREYTESDAYCPDAMAGVAKSKEWLGIK